MLRIRIRLLSAVVTGLLTIASSHSAEARRDATVRFHDSFDIELSHSTKVAAPAHIPLAIGHEELQQIRLVETTGGKERPVPAQVEPGSPPRLWWIVPAEPALPGNKRQYRVDKGTPAAASSKVTVERRFDSLLIRVGSASVLQYNKDHVDPPEGIDRRYGRSAHLHPCWTPQGVVVTDEFPPDHAHQSGIFLAHTKTEFEGRHPNFWDLLGGKGRVRCREVKGITEGPVFGELHVENEHVDLSAASEKVALIESWKLRVWNVGGPDAGGYWICDLTSSLQCASTSPLKLLQYHYGGMALRGARTWDGDHARFRTSEGKDRVGGNHTRPIWCDLSGPVGDRIAGLTFFTHPGNFRAPEPLRIHPKMPYMVYSPSHLGDWEISPGKPHVSRYQFVFHDGELPDAIANQLYSTFAEPLTPRR